MSADKLRIVFSGMLAGDPHQGGATWAVLQYVLGLKELGHHVLFIEPLSQASILPADSDLAYSTNANYFHHVVRQFGLENEAALVLKENRETVGLSYEQLVAFADEADLLLNVSGMLTDAVLLEGIRTRVYLDLDPAFIQLWHAVEGIDMRLDGHTHFVTVGLAIGSPECGVPLCGREWITTLQPVVLCHWEASSAATSPALTTIGNWRGYGSVQFNGELYGQKAHSFREFIDLPMKTRQPLVLAMAIHPGESADLEALRAHGWQLVDPGTVAGTPTLYRHFVAESKGEIGIAKSGYVKSRCGWFSDRSACYLAAGRPVIAQDTGFSKYLPTGRGLLPFTSELEAAQCIDRLNEDYDGHSQAARQLAEEFFASDKVLTRLLQHVGLAA